MQSTKAKLIEVSSQKSSVNERSPKEEQEKKKTVAPKLFPKSYLFAKWGDGLSEEEQKEAENLFKIYGYNVFLSNQLPLDRELPDTRDKK